jgi:hypothetical protein
MTLEEIAQAVELAAATMRATRLLITSAEHIDCRGEGGMYVIDSADMEAYIAKLEELRA